MHPLEEYLREVRKLHNSGAATDEQSYYPALKQLLDSVGSQLKPRVYCILNPADIGAGIPDIGLYTPDQLPMGVYETAPVATPPSRGAVEAKPTFDSAWITADGEQVTRYWNKYRTILVTNFRDFLLVGSDSSGSSAKLESYRLAENEEQFWSDSALHARRTAEKHGDQLFDFLRRVLLHQAPLLDPKDVALFLGSYARSARALIGDKDLSALNNLRDALSEVLGLTFTDKKGDHFFRSTLVQGLFYGIFAAWVFWSRTRPPNSPEKFDWKSAQHELHVPALRKLVHELTDPGQLKELGLPEVLSWTNAMLNRVNRESFFESFGEHQAVQYFYEPFLQAYDPELRKDLGVWYTPREIVRYMVERVDKVLRTHLGVAQGLAGDNVLVLDPCCGTGAYLVEVLRKIYKSVQAAGAGATAALQAKKAAMERVFGFEILPSPFVIAHLQVGMTLQELGAPLEDENERPAVFLTNALTGWEPPKGSKKQFKLVFPELVQEQKAATDVKREKPILVVLGNPPYNAFAGVSTDEEGHLVDVYKEGLASKWKIKKFNLDDLYIRFFRLAEKRIAEKTGKGIVAYISNASWITDASFVVLRKHLLDSFDCFWIENLHGNRKISEYAPDGRTSETIFALPGFSPGIQQPVATSLWVKTGKATDNHRIFFRDDINDAKAQVRRSHLLETLTDTDFDTKYVEALPNPVTRYSFKPLAIDSQYLNWPRIIDFCAEPPSYGLMEKRNGALIDINRDPLEKRMRAYFNPNLSWEQYCNTGYGLVKPQARFSPEDARQRASKEGFKEENIVRYSIRPFETRWAYYTGVRPVWNEPRPALWAQFWTGNRFVLTRFSAAKDPEGPPAYFTTALTDDHLLSPDAVAIPLRLKKNKESEDSTANLSKMILEYLAAIGFNPDKLDTDHPWMHVLAIQYAPQYLAENADGIRQDWPRVPLPSAKTMLIASSDLGRRLSALLNTDTGVAGVTDGAIRPEIAVISVPTREDGGMLGKEKGDLDLTGGWGHLAGGVVQPGVGTIFERDYTEAEKSATTAGAAALGLDLEVATSHLGDSTYDVYLNKVAFLRNIPRFVWEYRIGGYQVIKKWLSYRDMSVIGRSLSVDEVQELTGIARRIAAILLLESKLNANYEATKKNTFKQVN